MSQTFSEADPRPTSAPDSPPDLPPVEPPSAEFIVQLFVIPAVIVAVVVVVWLLFGKLASGERDARSYVELLRSDNANSWRAAFELASLIQNDPKLAQDEELLGELTELLDQELATTTNGKFDQYLALTLGGFQTLTARPVGGKPLDPLATLAAALEPRHDMPVRIAAAASLAKHAARLEGTLEDEAAVAALAKAGADPEPELRQIVTYALGFFGGEPAAEALRARLDDEDRYTRYNAAVALGRRDDPRALSVFREMLSTDAMARVIRIESRTERDSKIEAIQIEALQALQSAVAAGRTSLAGMLRPEVEGLAQSGLMSVRLRAGDLLKK